MRLDEMLCSMIMLIIMSQSVISFKEIIREYVMTAKNEELIYVYLAVKNALMEVEEGRRVYRLYVPLKVKIVPMEDRLLFYAGGRSVSLDVPARVKVNVTEIDGGTVIELWGG
ncbi:MAG: hypothetical protein J7L11_05565 [Thermoprotei archaeon]|nr:hypothetical protein [Thermoprotei archaeon]